MGFRWWSFDNEGSIVNLGCAFGIFTCGDFTPLDPPYTGLTVGDSPAAGPNPVVCDGETMTGSDSNTFRPDTSCDTMSYTTTGSVHVDIPS